MNNKKKCSLALTLLFAAHCSAELTRAQIEALQQSSPYFNTKTLGDAARIDEHLKEDGFETVWFQTEDGYDLEGRIRQGENDTHTVVVGGGFYPGLLQGNTTITALLPEDSNATVLLYNARGHGNSEGPFLSRMWNYGLNETKDLEAALKCAQDVATGTTDPENPQPILYWGTCASANFALRFAGEKPETATKLGVRGIMADSPWRGIKEDVSRTAIQEAITEKCAIPMVRCFYPRTPKKDLPKLLLYKAARACFVAPLNYTLRPFCLAMGASKNAPITDFTEEKARKIPGAIKVMCVMSQDDTIAPIEHMRPLIGAIPNTEWCEFESAKHSCSILKHPVRYYEHLRSMQEYVVGKNQN